MGTFSRLLIPAGSLKKRKGNIFQISRSLGLVISKPLKKEELVVLMKRTGSCKHGYLIFQNVWQWHICISENQFLGFWESRLWTLRTILITPNTGAHFCCTYYRLLHAQEIIKVWPNFVVFSFFCMCWVVPSLHRKPFFGSHLKALLRFFLKKFWNHLLQPLDSFVSWKRPLPLITCTPSPIWTRGVSYHGLAIYIKKYLKAKEELWKLKYISPCQNIIFKTIL